VDPTAVRVDASVDESGVTQLAPGQQAQITFDALPNRRFQGKVIAIAPTGPVQQGVVTYLVSIEVDARNATLPAGLTASVEIVVSQRNGVLLVPNRAIKTQGRQRTVEVLVDGKPQTRPIRVGMSNDQFTEVIEGLSEGEQVVIPTTTTAPPRTPAMVPGLGFGGGPPPR